MRNLLFGGYQGVGVLTRLLKLLRNIPIKMHSLALRCHLNSTQQRANFQFILPLTNTGLGILIPVTRFAIAAIVSGNILAGRSPVIARTPA